MQARRAEGTALVPVVRCWNNHFQSTNVVVAIGSLQSLVVLFDGLYFSDVGSSIR